MQEAQNAKRAPIAAPEMGHGPETRHTPAGDETILNTARARQGVTGHHVRMVLILGIAAVVVAFAIAYYFVR